MKHIKKNYVQYSMKNLGTFNDKVIGANYKLDIFDSAKDLSNKLKDTYSKLNIDFKQFNSTNYNDGDIKNPPQEIYEYQNFFLLEKSDGNIILLDGFRRLLWYTAPDTPIMVRTYKQEELTSTQILTLLVYLNHFKFFQDSSSYQERGFGLLLKSVFDIDISNFRKAFDAYLSSDKIKNSYSIGSDSGNSKNLTVKERIVNKHFVSDMKFLSKLNENDCMVNKFFGALVYKKRLEYDEDFSSDKFLELANNDKVLAGLMVKLKKVGTNNSVKSQEVVNQIQQIYNNYFTLMAGGEVEKSYAEKVEECKEIRKKLNKDKQWTKLTGHKDVYAVERAMIARLSKEKTNSCLKFKMIVMPKNIEVSSYGFKNTIPLKYGYNELPVLVGFVKPKHFGASDEMQIGFKDPETGANWIIKHNYGSYNSYGKKYTTADFKYEKEIIDKYMPGEIHNVSYKIELWVNVPQEEWKRLEDERMGRS